MTKSFIKKIIPRTLWLFAKRRLFHMYVLCAAAVYSFKRHRVMDYKSIPIIICNYNRLTFLQRLIASLEKRGYRNIHIIDNNSTYPPLLEYYKLTSCDVIRLNENSGYTALWRSDVYQRFRNSYYVYTDSDMEIDENCPDDFMEHFVNFLNRHPLCQKVGFGIRIDDIPECFSLKGSVLKEEAGFWTDEEESGFFKAKIDTTFALYRPYCKGPASDAHIVYRTGFPYIIKHLPWYVDSRHLDDEEKYYISHASGSTHWTVRAK